jgi:phenylacetate-CoA ligase
MGVFQSIYPYLPVTLQNIMVSGYGYLWRRRRYGGVFSKYLEAFKEREAFSISQWADYQNTELRKLVLHAFDTVPYYHRTFRAAGLTREVMRKLTVDDLSKLPVLEKETLRRLGTTELLSSKRERGGAFFTSSGSTGTPVKILFSKAMHQKWRAAFDARVYQWAGVNHESSRGMIGGRVVVPGGDKAKPPYFRYNFFEKQIYFSIYHIRRENAWNYLEAIKKYRPEFMTGYAASNYLLASYFEEMGYDIDPLKAVITSSEKLTDKMRATLERVYKCRVFDSWSGIEACGLISQHPNGNLYSSPDLAVLEILDNDLNPVRPGHAGNLYCTGFLNYDQPLIRYRIGDVAILGTSDQPGPNMPVISEIVGREDDVVTLADGRQLSSFNRFFADLNGIREVQVVQHDFDHFVFNLVVSPEYDTKSEKELMQAVEARLGKVRVDLNRVDRIERNVNGKFKAVISHVPSNLSK